jgi:8-oxo-dGTP pyrophosphatase MutT (NUDIX family)
MNRDWQSELARAVSPIHDGVRPLRVGGVAPKGGTERPNRTAAVLVPVLDRDQPEIVFTRRSEQLAHHPGQISFPGGAAEGGNETAVNTALREAREEIGLHPDLVTPLGFLDRLDTISDFRVLPVVGIVSPVPQWRPDHREVAEVFTVPLDVVLDSSRFEKRVVEQHGMFHTIYSLSWHERVIWGITAAVLVNLQERMKKSGDS